jgi:phenylacetate-CoA ligase
MDITKLTDLLTGKNISGYYKEYTKTQWYSDEQMQAYQLEKLQKLVTHCYDNVPYYTKIMDLKGISPHDVISIDIIKSFPILTKEIIKANYEDFIPKNLSIIKGVKTSQTGGTTGNILFKRNDSNTRSSVWASFKRFTEEWMNIAESNKKLILMGGHVMGSSLKEKLKKKAIGIMSNSMSFSPYDTSEQNTENIIKVLQENRFEQIRSYSQFLYQLSLKLKQRGLKFNVKAITTTAEPLMPEHRKLFKEVFNAEIFDQYGCGEIGGIAYECNHHKGLHITEEKVILEVNENNELIVTDLDNYAMPFIRYWNADQAILTSERCSCGRQSRLIKQIMGRTCDYIIGVNGEILHWAYFWHLFFDSKVADKRNLRKFQVVQRTKYELLIRFVADMLSDEEKQVLIDNIQSRLGSIQVVFYFEDDIENSPSGKYRPVINNLL